MSESTGMRLLHSTFTQPKPGTRPFLGFDVMPSLDTLLMRHNEAARDRVTALSGDAAGVGLITSEEASILTGPDVDAAIRLAQLMRREGLPEDLVSAVWGHIRD